MGDCMLTCDHTGMKGKVVKIPLPIDNGSSLSRVDSGFNKYGDILKEGLNT